VIKPIQNIAWSNDEDTISVTGLIDLGSKWLEISKLLENRSSASVQGRARALFRQELKEHDRKWEVIVDLLRTGELSHTPSPSHQQWTKDEHDLFLKGVEEHGPGNWKKIAVMIPTKNGKQVASHATWMFDAKFLKARACNRNVCKEECKKLTSKMIMSDISEAKDRDVLPNGLGMSLHPGNIVYGRLMNLCKDLYAATPSLFTKMDIVQAILLGLREHQVRFLVKATNGKWYDRGHEAAFEKILNALWHAKQKQKPKVYCKCPSHPEQRVSHPLSSDICWLCYTRLKQLEEPSPEEVAMITNYEAVSAARSSRKAELKATNPE
jgi:SHAQKYF class myb-like DNA-binding protein